MMGLTQEPGSRERPQYDATLEKGDKCLDKEKEKQAKGQEGKGVQERCKERMVRGEEGGEWESEGELKKEGGEEGGEEGGGERKRDKGNSITGAPGN